MKRLPGFPARTFAAILGCLAASGLLAVPVVTSTGDAETTSGQVMAPEFRQLSADDFATSGSVDAPTVSGAATAPDNTDFVLQYSANVDPASRQVLEAAAGVWSAVVEVSVPIVVEVDMEPMGPGLLGSAGPTSAFYGRASFPAQDVLYPVALANQLAGSDLAPRQSDIQVTLSSTFDWDKSLDGTAAPDKQSLLTVAIHELGHGLGHTSWVRDGGDGLIVDFLIGGVEMALAYDTFVASESGKYLIDVLDSLVASTVTAPLYWTGPQGVAANGGSRPSLYAPSVYEPGSSVGHLDESQYPGLLMTPDLHNRERHVAVPAITRAMLGDIGWKIEAPTGATSDATTTQSPTESDAFVTAVVKDFLGRLPTSAELQSWKDYLAAGGSRAAVAEHYAYSDEWVGVIVDGFYKSTLGRTADASGRAFWIDVIRSGETPARVASLFYASQEYYDRSGGTDSKWVQDLYVQILGRKADAGGVEFWVARTANIGREAVALDFYQSWESRLDRVDGLYRTLLGRPPETSGWGFWAEVLGNGRDVDLATSLAGSAEYFDRAIKRFA